MADEYILKHLQDVLTAITELESVFVGYPMRYDVFEKDNLRRWAVERKAEIMSEAMVESENIILISPFLMQEV